jgi:type I restriction enzyme S subunit
MMRAEQQKIVRRLAGLFALADRLEQRLVQACRQVDQLTSSLLACSFAGQLVPQNPADELAEKMLARIRRSGRCRG